MKDIEQFIRLIKSKEAIKVSTYVQCGKDSRFAGLTSKSQEPEKLDDHTTLNSTHNKLHASWIPLDQNAWTRVINKEYSEEKNYPKTGNPHQESSHNDPTTPE